MAGGIARVVLYPGSNIIIHRLARHCRPPPKHSHRLDISLFIYVSGNPRGAYDSSQLTQRGGLTPSSSLSVCTRLVEAQLPPSSLPGNGPSHPPLYRCMYHPGDRFSLANKVQECMELTFVPIFSHTKLLLLSVLLVFMGLTPNMRKNVR